MTKWLSLALCASLCLKAAADENPRLTKARDGFRQLLENLDETVEARIKQRTQDYLERLEKYTRHDEAEYREAAKAELERFRREQSLTHKHIVRMPTGLKSLQMTYRKYLTPEEARRQVLSVGSLNYRAQVGSAFQQALREQNAELLAALEKDVRFLQQHVRSYKPPHDFERTLSIAARSWGKTANSKAPDAARRAVAGGARTWTDVTGRFQVKAVFLDLQGEMVQLKTADGNQLAVPLEKLSEADRRHIRQLAARRSGATEFDKVAGQEAATPEFDIKPFAYSDLEVPDRKSFGAALHEIAATAAGELWFATNRGLVRLGPAGAVKVDPFQASDVHPCAFVRVTGEGVLWAYFPKFGLARREDENWQAFPIPDDMRTERVTSLAITPDGVIWIAAGNVGPMLQFKDGSWSYSQLKGERAWPFLKMIAADDGSIWGWVGGDGLRQYRDGEYKRIHSAPNPVPHRMAKAPDGRLLFGFEQVLGRGGLLIIDGDKHQLLTKENSPLPTDHITGLGYAPDGALWIGLHNQGVARVHGGSWRFFALEKFKHKQRASYVRQVLTSQDGSVWVHSDGWHRISVKGNSLPRPTASQPETSDRSQPAPARDARSKPTASPPPGKGVK